jgi:aminoglycoside phosphotransferase family enzyme/predicted kinase
VRDLVQDLRRPDRYPAPVPSSVALETTLLSWVFLTDTEAWKVKRPVEYGYADHTTIERRLRSCEEEVRLNRRLAPQVYLGVRPVRRDRRGFSFVGTGKVVDHAVRMRRLPADRSAESLLAEGRLTPELLDELALTLAYFYSKASSGSGRGGVDDLKTTLEENLDQVEPFVGDVVGIDDYRGLRDWQERFLKANRDRFQDRVVQGRIREGHGDLRLEHVYFIDGRPIVIDAIEFNDRFRILDPASDAAFLAMELEHRRRPDLAGWFMGRFAAATNDFGFYPLLDFYLVTKAWIRAKVACFVAADPSTPAAKAARKREEARSLFTLATAFSRPAVRQPCLIAFGGTVGSGKSTMAEGLSRAVGFPVVSSDVTRKGLAGIPLSSKGDATMYADSMTEEVYHEILLRADQVLESGRSVILDATFGRRAHRDDLRRLSASRGVPFLFVETRCDPATARERLRRRVRGPAVSDAGPDLLEESIRSFQPVDELSPAEKMVADTDTAPARILPMVLDRLP